jgi:hypothetical protein
VNHRTKNLIGVDHAGPASIVSLYTEFWRIGIPQKLVCALIYVVKCVRRSREAISSSKCDPIHSYAIKLRTVLDLERKTPMTGQPERFFSIMGFYYLKRS